MTFKQKKGFLLRDFVVVGIVFGMVIALFVVAVADIANTYNNHKIINENFASHYSQLSKNLKNLDSGYSAVKGAGGLNLIGTFNVVFNSVFTVIIMIWDGIMIYTGMATNISGDFSFLDASTVLILLGGVVAIITVYLIFIWLSSVTRGKI